MYEHDTLILEANVSPSSYPNTSSCAFGRNQFRQAVTLEMDCRGCAVIHEHKITLQRFIVLASGLIEDKAVPVRGDP
jgi:hypothetical protein